MKTQKQATNIEGDLHLPGYIAAARRRRRRAEAQSEKRLDDLKQQAGRLETGVEKYSPDQSCDERVKRNSR